MKTTPQLFIIGLLLTVTFCGRTSNNEIIVRKPKRDTTENYKKTKDSLKNPLDKKIDYIIFGRFCGECGGECATMYKLDILNNKLFADHTDSYWEYKRGTPMKFATTIVDKRINHKANFRQHSEFYFGDNKNQSKNLVVQTARTVVEFTWK